jgi:MMPL family
LQHGYTVGAAEQSQTILRNGTLEVIATGAARCGNGRIARSDEIARNEHKLALIVSGSTVAIGLVSMVIIPIRLLRSICIGGMLIPAVSVLVATTMLPALLPLRRCRFHRRPTPVGK